MKNFLFLMTLLSMFFSFYSPVYADSPNHQEDAEAYNNCLYFLNNEFRAKDMQEAASHILNWYENSVGSEAMATSQMLAWMNQYTKPYVVAFIAANAEYTMRYGCCKSKDRYANSIVRLLNYYNYNKKRVGKVDLLEQYNKLYRNDPQSFFTLLGNDFDTAKQSSSLAILR